MFNIILILIFAALVCLLGVYILTRKIFTRSSRKMAWSLSVLVTALLTLVLAFVMLGTAI